MKKIGIKRPIPPEVLKVARSVRKWVLRVNGGPEDMCYDASCAIQRRLAKRGIKCKVVGDEFIVNPDSKYPEGHYWVAIGRKFLDVTGDQFNYLLEEEEKTTLKPIVFGTPKDLNGYYNYTIVEH